MSEFARYLLSASPAVIFTCHADGDYATTYISENVTDLLGYDPQDFLIDPSFWMDRVHPEDLPKVLAALETVFKDGHHVREYRFKAQNGEYRWLRDELRLAYNEATGTSGFVGSWLDITERRVLEENYRSLSQLTSDYVHKCTRTGAEPFRIQWLDGAVNRITGFSSKEIMEQGCWLTVVHPDDRPAVADYLSSLVPGDSKTLEFRVVTKEQKIRWVSEKSYCKAGESEGELVLLGAVTDVTERRQAEAALRDSEELYRALVNTIPLGVMLIDQDFRIVTINESQAALFQHLPEWFIGRHCYEIFEKREQVCPHCPGVVSLRTGEVARAEAKGVRDDGSRTWVRLQTVPLQLSNGTAGFIEVAEEISEYRKLEAKAQQMAYLAALGEMASGVAHEINNPVSGIINCAELLHNRLLPENSCHEIVERIVREGDRIANIVKSLLSIAQPGQGRKELFSIKESLNTVTTLFRDKLVKSGIDLQIDIPGNLPEIKGERQQIEQLLLNLISNALYALNARFPDCHPDKRLSITATRRTVAGKEGVCLEVYDQGTGICREELARIFDPFFTTKPAGTGTGLGLGICHGIVKGHDGEILVESEFGRFTRVTVELPTV